MSLTILAATYDGIDVTARAQSLIQRNCFYLPEQTNFDRLWSSETVQPKSFEVSFSFHGVTMSHKLAVRKFNSHQILLGQIPPWLTAPANPTRIQSYHCLTNPTLENCTKDQVKQLLPFLTFSNSSSTTDLITTQVTPDLTCDRIVQILKLDSLNLALSHLTTRKIVDLEYLADCLIILSFK